MLAQPMLKAPATRVAPAPAILLGGGQQREGRPLPEDVQRKMELFFEADFSEVRIHIGPEAPSIGALAFTVGTDIYFGPGQYAPHTEHGERLLGHELTHVVQ